MLVTAIDYKEKYEELLKEHEDFKASSIGQIEALKVQLEQLKKMIFGSKQERFVSSSINPAQLSLGIQAEEVATTSVTSAKKIEYTRTKVETTPKNHPGRAKLPQHLRRDTVVLLPDTDVTGLKHIGDEITEVLDYIPGELYVKQYRRPKYVQPLSDVNSTVITASLPDRIMEKCMAGEGLLAHIIVAKYVDHMPLDRQMKQFARAGVEVAQSTINDWVKAVLNQVAALYEAHKKALLACGYLHADETPLKVLDKDKKGTTHLGYYWVYHNSKDKLVMFDYRRGRGREGPDDILKDYQGYLQTDGYVAYEDFDKRQGITLIHCMAHARRKFNEALQNDQARAGHALSLFQKLYAIERKIKEEQLSHEEILTLRQDQAVPILKELKDWMIQEYPNVLPASLIGKAIAYSLPRWDKLIIYASNPILNIDNNPVENAIRPIAIGRKNYLFAGSHDAAQRAAMIYSLFATCRQHNINPYDWLKDVLERLHLYTTNNISELLPQNWKRPEQTVG